MEVIPAGVPNITGSITASNETSGLVGPQSIASGALYVAEPAGIQGVVHNQQNSANCPLGFDASRSNPCYGNAETVQPPALQLITQIRF